MNQNFKVISLNPCGLPMNLQLPSAAFPLTFRRACFDLIYWSFPQNRNHSTWLRYSFHNSSPLSPAYLNKTQHVQVENKPQQPVFNACLLQLTTNFISDKSIFMLMCCRIILFSVYLPSFPSLSSWFIYFSFLLQWVFAWTPYCIVSLIGIMGYGSSISPFASMLPSIFAKSACCIDPYLYAVTHPRFRTELEKIFCSNRESNFQTSYSRRNNDRNESECETINLGPENNERKKRPLQRAESSFCEESTVSQ